MVKRVYLDTNVYCRPRDDQSDPRVRRESGAFMEIVERAVGGEVEIVSSDYVKFEVERMNDPLKRKDVRGLERALVKINIKGGLKKVVESSRLLQTECNINALDALHIISAYYGKAEFFLTCDDEILSRRTCIEGFLKRKEYKIKVRNPIEYVEEMGE